jgi:dihydroxyacetone kinase/dihydroxyacetone kinase-like protein
MSTVKNDHPLKRANDAVDSRWSELISRVHMERTTRRMLSLVVIAFVIFAVLAPGVFLSPINLQNIALASPEIGVLAVAMMLAMLTGGIDLSLVSIANLSAITMSTMYTAMAATDPARAESMFPAIVLAGVLVGLAGGAINGLLVSVVGITPILATLGTMQIYNGIAVAWTGGSTLYGAPSALTAMGMSTLAGIPVLFLAFILIAVGVGGLLNRTPLGLKVQLQGANPIAARYSGIRGRSVLMSTYLLTGLLGGIAGVLFLARNPTASADYGASYVLLVIVIAVLGGTNPNGGYATVLGVVLATLTLQIVSSGFTAIRLSAYEYAIAQGVILIAVMVLDQVECNERELKPMKKIINKPEQFVDEMIEGILLAHPDKVRTPGDDKRILVRADAPLDGKVGIVTGGGSGHLPLFKGYVGRGLCSGVAIGNVFSSPSSQQVFEATKAVNGGAGVLYLYGNYGGDVFNFDLAADLAELEDIPTRTVLGRDDVASQPNERKHDRRGVAGILFAYKAAGAAAERGDSLDEVAAVAEDVVEHTATMGIGLSPTILPTTGALSFDLPEGEMEIGIGIHGEPGIHRGPLETADEITDRIVAALIDDLGLETGDRVAVLVNGMGATPLEELYVVYRRVHQVLSGQGVEIAKSYVGEYATSLEMAGLSISLLKLNDDRLELLNAPALSPFFQES